ncbi:MAG: hypothetical protein IBJ18_12600 [Phycisphaerales bacterium]|nr:hypothetical protein [Phycisphaerales bacterium]
MPSFAVRSSRCASHLSIAASLTLLLASSASHAALQASAAFTPTLQPAGEYSYAGQLTNTGTTTVGTFWFAWIPGQNYLASTPFTITSPAGWTATVTHGSSSDGWGIRWTASTTNARIAPGASLSGFSFKANISPLQLSGNSPFYPSVPMTRSFVYSAAAFSDAGYSFEATVVPTPTTATLLALSAAALTTRRRRA